MQKILLKGENSATSQRLSVLAKPACRDGGTARNPTVVSSSTTEDAEETETTSRPSQLVSGGVDEEENVSDFKINIFNAGEHLLNHLIYPNDIRLVFNRVVCTRINGMAPFLMSWAVLSFQITDEVECDY